MTAENGKQRLDPEDLTPADMRRAKVALGGRNPYELLDDPVELIPLIIWCLRTRTDPTFTLEQAETVRFGDFIIGGAGEDDPDPLPVPPVSVPSPEGSGSSSGPNGSAATPSEPVPARSSARSSGSPETSTSG